MRNIRKSSAQPALEKLESRQLFSSSGVAAALAPMESLTPAVVTTSTTAGLTGADVNGLRAQVEQLVTARLQSR